MALNKKYTYNNKYVKNNDPYSKNQDGLKKLPRGFRTKALHKLKGLHFLDDIGGAIKFELVLPEALLGAIDGTVHLDDPRVQEILQRIDSQKPADVQMAKRVVRLQDSQFRNSPLTELIMFDWFTQSNVQFDYQIPLGGGRSTKMGQVLDFAAYSGGSAIALPCQGQYWHTKPDVAASDELDKLSAMGQYVNGFRIEKYIPVWERQLYKDREMVLSYALAGIEMGP